MRSTQTYHDRYHRMLFFSSHTVIYLYVTTKKCILFMESKNLYELLMFSVLWPKKLEIYHLYVILSPDLNRRLSFLY